MYQATIQDSEPQLTPNQVAVIHFLDALKDIQPFLYILCWLHVENNDPEMLIWEMERTLMPATWKNQAKQASMLLKGDQ